MRKNTFAMMEGTYFVPRGELLQWLNNTFNSSITKIEELASGAMYCQIFDECMPGKLQMSKVNWNAKQEYEYISNFKILQQGFTNSGLKKNIEVEKLVKGKCQDNLEMLQWMKKFFDTNFNGTIIKERRVPTPNPKIRILSERNSSEKTKTRDRSVVDKIKKYERQNLDMIKMNSISPANKPKSHEETFVERVKALDANKIAMDTLQKERDFYFEKLREIELKVQEFPDKEHDLVKQIQVILYSDDL